MSKQPKETQTTCDKYTASTLAAASIMRYFKEQNWQMISFFPNAVCVQQKKCKYKSDKK